MKPHKRRGRKAKLERMRRAQERERAKPRVDAWLPRWFEIYDPIRPGRLAAWAKYIPGEVANDA